MARQFILKHESWGDYPILVLHESEEGLWESKWEVLKSYPELEILTSNFSRISQAAYQDALRKHTLPLIQELGLPPKACLIKTPSPWKMCSHRKGCAMYNKKQCLGDNSKVPVCYQVDLGELPDNLEILVTELLEFWRMGFHVIVVSPPEV